MNVPQEHTVPAATAAGAAGAPGVLVTLPAGERPTPVSVDAPVLANRHLGDRYWEVRLHAPEIAARFAPGQFVMVTVARQTDRGPVLPRPMAIYDADPGAGWIALVYSVVGAGTRELTGFREGELLCTVGPLGRGFDLPPGSRRPEDAARGHARGGGVLLLGRGIGTCSLAPLTAGLGPSDAHTAVTSGRHPGAVIGRDLYERRGVRCLPVHDADGSADTAALARAVHELHDDRPPALIAVCGARRLETLALELSGRWGSDVQVALEARMACGLGYCHGCSTGERNAAAEAPLICRDGPVFGLRPAAVAAA